MAFKIKVDEDLPMDVVKKLKERSYETYNVLASISLKDMSSMLIVATPKRIRIRRK